MQTFQTLVKLAGWQLWGETEIHRTGKIIGKFQLVDVQNLLGEFKIRHNCDEHFMQIVDLACI